ncbi:peptidoglycan-binding protein [Xanthomonas campestris]|uniref:peptidoglycan-binding domain-containing protein n=1 Tax=Xanthomonas cannabis TaxID=1885674 RepID=UPI001E3E81BC|nr:peptidoglycan-binding protein [Xanthomonas campestris pv. zinniae]
MPTKIDTRDLETVSGAVYFSVGRGTEGGAASYHLAIAGITVGTSEPHWGEANKVAQNSGYSLGTIQVDFGQRGTWPLGSIENRALQPGEQTYVDGVIQQAAAYAKEHKLPFAEDHADLRKDLLSHGNGLNGRSTLNFVDAGTRDSINAWAGSTEGKQWIHSNIDYPQVRNATQTAMGILDAHGANIAEDRRFEAISLLAKTANQMPSQLSKLEKVLKDGGDYDALLAKADQIRTTHTYYDGPKAASVAEKYEDAYPQNQAALDRAHVKVSDRDFDPSSERTDPDIRKALELVHASPGKQVTQGHLLKEGSNGREVRKLESNLSALGYGDSDGNALQTDQNFDVSTKQAVEAFQRANGLIPVDGKAGPSTLGAIDQQAKSLQSNLIELGFTGADGKPLRVDGYLGNGTRQALSAFQDANGLPITGVADRLTLDNLTRQIAEQAQANDPARANEALPKPAGGAQLLSDPDHSHNALFRQMLEKVHTAETQRGIPSGVHSERLAGTLSVEGIRSGLTSVDRVELNNDGSLARAVQISTTRDEAALNRSTSPVHTAQAVNQTLQESSELAQQAVATERLRTMEQTQQQHQTRAPANMMA